MKTPYGYLKKLKRYATPGHARSINFCTQDMQYTLSDIASDIIVSEIECARRKYGFKLWAFVIMSNHAHLLIWPLDRENCVPDILQDIKGRSSKFYSAWLKEHDYESWKKHIVIKNQKETFRLWSRGGGFDRNVWETQSILNIIRYIENNPVKAGLVKRPSDWKWSSAWGRMNKTGVVPDEFSEWV